MFARGNSLLHCRLTSARDFWFQLVFVSPQLQGAESHFPRTRGVSASPTCVRVMGPRDNHLTDGRLVRAARLET